MPKKPSVADKAKKKPKKASVTPASQEVDTVLLTRDGLEKLKEELTQLTKVRRKEVADRLKEAISYGDLSENSEYEQAKYDQAFVEGRIAELEAKIKHAKVIESDTDSATVQIGSTVKLRNVTDQEDEAYTIVGSTEADPMEGKISNESPVGHALLGKRAKDEVTVQAPGGAVKYRIVDIV